MQFRKGTKDAAKSGKFANCNNKTLVNCSGNVVDDEGLK